MFKLSQTWLEEVSLEDEILRLRKLRKSKKIILCHVSHEINRLMNCWSSLMCEKHRVQLLHAELDLQLALIDGRMEIIKEVPKLAKKESKIKDSILALTEEERRILIKELSSL